MGLNEQEAQGEETKQIEERRAKSYEKWRNEGLWSFRRRRNKGKGGLERGRSEVMPDVLSSSRMVANDVIFGGLSDSYSEI